MYNQPITTYEGFSINPAYQTPAYMANFRPAYAADTDPYNSYAINRGYFQAIKQQYLFGGRQTGYEADPMQEDRANNWSITSQHSDAFVNAITKVGIPVASWYAANKILSRKIGAVSPTAGLWDKGAAFSKALYSGEGLGAARAAWTATAARQTLGGAAGSILGRGVGSVAGGVIGAGARMLGIRGAIGATAGGLGSAGAIIGGGLGSLLAPMAAASMVASAVNNVIATPYVGLRRGEDAMLANTANTFVSGGSGPNYGTFGVSASHANRLSRAFMDANIKDMGFEVGDYAAIADYGMQMGLFNDIGNLNVDDMKRRVKGMAESVKLIMAVANTSSVKEALQYMGRLKSAGVTNPVGVQRVMAELGIASGVSGSSVEQIMNTVGNQGQLMAQQLGMLPVLGQRSAATAYAGFSNAYKSGGLAPSDIASLGGVDGATQYYQQAQHNMFRSAYFTAAANSGQEIGKGRSVQVASAYGARRAKDPLGAYSLDIINAGVARSEMVEKYGPDIAMINALYDMSETVPGIRDSTGKVDFVKAIGLAYNKGFMTEQEARATALYAKSMMDPEASRRMEEGVSASAERMFYQRRDQDGYMTAAGVPILGKTIQDFRHFGRSATGVGGDFMGEITRVRSYMADQSDKFSAWFNGTVTKSERGVQQFVQEGDTQFLATAVGTIDKNKLKETPEGFRALLDMNDTYLSTADNQTAYMNEVLRLNQTAESGSELKAVTDEIIAGFGNGGASAKTKVKLWNLTKGQVGVSLWETIEDYLANSKYADKYGEIKREKVSVSDVRNKLNKGGAKSWADSRGFFDRLTDPTEGYGLELAGKVMSEDRFGALMYDVIDSWTVGGHDEAINRFTSDSAKGSFVNEDFAKIYVKDAKDRTDEENLRVESFEAYLSLAENKEQAKKVTSALTNIGFDRGSNQDYLDLYSKDTRKMATQVVKRAQEVTDQFVVDNPEIARQVGAFRLAENGYEGKDLSPLYSLSNTAFRNGVESTANIFHNAPQSTKAAYEAAEERKKYQKIFGENFSEVSLEGIKSMSKIESSLSQLIPEQSKLTKEMADATSALQKIAKASGNEELVKTLNELNTILRNGPSVNIQNNPGSGRSINTWGPR